MVWREGGAGSRDADGVGFPQDGDEFGFATVFGWSNEKLSTDFWVSGRAMADVRSADASWR